MDAVLTDGGARGRQRATLEVRRIESRRAAALRSGSGSQSPASAGSYYTHPEEDALILWRAAPIGRPPRGRPTSLKACISCGTVPVGAFRQTAHLFSKEAKMPDRLRRAEAKASAERRRVPPARHSASRPRRTDPRPGRPHHLSEPEQLEEVTLKKRKLQLKDQMEMHSAAQRRRIARARSRAPDRRLLTRQFPGPAAGHRRWLALCVPTPSAMKIDRAGFPFIAAALVPAVGARRHEALQGQRRVRAADRLPHLLLPRSRAAGPDRRRTWWCRRPTAGS